MAATPRLSPRAGSRAASRTSVGSSPSGSGSRLPAPGTPGVLYLVDLSGYVFRAYHAISPLSSSKGEPTHAVMGTVSMLQKVVNERQPDMLAVAMDSRGKNFRNEIDARYKATRPAPPPDLSQQLARCEAIVKAYNIPIYREIGVEADDLIACVVKRARADGIRVVIVSADKDMMQLVDDEKDDVVLWDSMRDRVYGPPEVRTKFGVAPSRVRDLLALTGDTSDNIPGVPGVGPKTAADLLNEFGTLEGIYASIESIKRAKLKENLKTYEEDAKTSQRLVTLRVDCDIPWDPSHLRYGGADVPALRELFLDLEFTRLLDQLVLGTTTPSLHQQNLADERAGRGAAPETRTYETITTTEGLATAIERIREKRTMGFDLELAGSDPMTADVIGVSLSAEPGRAFYVPVAHRYLGAPAQLSLESVLAALEPIWLDPGVEKKSHHLKLAHLVLARFGKSIAGDTFDTMLASYLLDPDAPSQLRELARRVVGIEMPSYADGPKPIGKRVPQVPFENLPIEEATPFAAAEADVCVSLSERYAPRLEREGLERLFRDVEQPLARVLAQMEREGVLVDAKVLESLGRRVEGDLRSLEAQAKEIAKADFSVRSRDQLEKILFDELKLPVLKRTPKGGRSTDAEVLEELAEQHALPKVICDFREIDKLKGTYIDTLPRAINPKTGRIHTRFNQTVAATGRLASSDPNLQNIPVRTELGREIRAAFVAPPGYRLVSADYSQIELRVLAHLSGDPELLAAFSSTQEDVHTHTASLVFDVPRDQVTQEMRRRSKTINFGVIYGMGDSALARQLDITRAEAASFIEAYFRRYAKVASFMRETVQAAGKGEAVRTLLGRRRFLPNLHSANRGLRMEAERIAKNTPIQGTAADILKVAMVKLGRGDVVPDARMILTVHDELVFEVPEAKVEEAMGRIREEMEAAIRLDVPLVVDVGQGLNWNDAH